MLSNRPESSAVGPVEPAGRTGDRTGGAPGVDGGYIYKPRPPALPPDSAPDQKPSACPTVERYSLTLQALPDNGGPAAARRLARGLKHLLRSCRLRCTEVREITPRCPLPPDGQSIDPAAARGRKGPR
jgi:hypothetical protein